MNAKRIAALLLSVAMVAGAFVVRDRLDEQEELDRVPLRVACASELGAACERLRDRGYNLVIEPALVTSRRLAAQDPDELDTELWLTVEPSAALVNAERTRRGAPLLYGPTAVTPVATTELVLVAWRDRGEVLRRACATLTMRCVGEVAGKGAWSASGGRGDWGQVRVALPDPSESAAGLLALGAGAQSWFGRSGVGSNDFDSDPAFGDWMAGLARAAPTDGSLARMLAIGRAALDMAIVPRAEAEELDADAADVLTLELAPTTAVRAVAVTLVGSRGRGEDLADALRWPERRAGNGTALAPDVLEALRLRWLELSR